MPKRTDIQKILILGSGPIIIGQACEFDYSGTQACKALKEEGYEIILANSNPATIMTDPTIADRTYIEPLTPEILAQIIEKERPDAILPTLGGQTGLNLAMALHHQGVLEKFNVEMIGANAKSIEKAEDRKAFKIAMQNIGLELPTSAVAYSLEEAKQIAQEIGFPCVVRPSFTMGGTGGGIAFNIQELESISQSGLRNSPTTEILIEESILGWKEFELEVMRDHKDNVVIICSIENLDPMGVHTGDSITVAPIQTLTDKDYQKMRNAAIAVIREIGVDTGGSNVQFALNPQDGRIVIIEMNPRVSRSSALASKATGFPIAKIAAKLAVGYTLDELPNDITRKTPACFEPALDYCVIKIPRFHFEKFPKTAAVLGTSMKSVGEIMAIGRTFKEALQKGLRSMETKLIGFGPNKLQNVDAKTLVHNLTVPNANRMSYIYYALTEGGMSVEEVHQHSKIDTWFLYHMANIIRQSQTLSLDKASLQEAKAAGFSDAQIAHFTGKSESEVRNTRKSHGIIPTYKLVDTCAAEFEAQTPYYYSTYEQENEARVSQNQRKVMILGGGPNRIGQGIEFDYCCVHASMAAREEGVESIMVNSNPETVSTDFDISNKLYFEPLTFEDVLNIYELEKPEGVIVQFGGQTPLNIASALENAGVKILGTSTASIDMAEDRKLFQSLIQSLNLKQPENGTAVSVDEAIVIAKRVGYPVLVRPSFVLGGASMEIVYSDMELEKYMQSAIDVSSNRPVLIDKYLEDAIEIDVDALSDGDNAVIAGIMQHIEQAGIHSGDSACVIPPHSISQSLLTEIKAATYKLAKALNVVGLMNIQFAIRNGELYILEVNPRGSRSVPFVSKATGVQWAKMATKIILGKKISELGLKEVILPYTAVKEAVFPFNRFPGVDIILGPEMKSTGEVMGIDQNFGLAYIKAQIAAGQTIPKSGCVFISVTDRDKPQSIPIAKSLAAMGFSIIATQGTSAHLQQEGVPASPIYKVGEGRPNIADEIMNGSVQLIINTPLGKDPIKDEIVIRQTALQYNIPVITTMAGALATIEALETLAVQKLNVQPIQDYYRTLS